MALLIIYLIVYVLQFVILTECVLVNDSTLTNANVNQNNSQLIKTSVLHNGARKLENESRPIITHEKNFFSPDLLRLKSAINALPSGLCKNDSEAVLEAILRHETWALKMFDSSPKFPVGMLYGSHYQLGNFDECIGIKAVLSHEQRAVQGQYCLADVSVLDGSSHNHQQQHHDVPIPRIAFNSTLHWAICIPSSCSPKELEVFLNKILNAVLSYTTIKVSVPELRCHYERDIPFTTSEIIYGCVIGAFVVFVLLATTFHVVQIYRTRRCLIYNVNSKKNVVNIYRELFLSFSLVKSIRKLLHIGSADVSLDCIFGIKLISMFLILCSHSLLFLIAGPVLNEDFYIKAVTKPQNAILLNNPLLVDTFLLISGFLMCKLLLAELDKNKGKVNILGLYIARYIRLTPSYAVVIFFYYTVFIRIDNGPLWKERITTEQNRCVKSWWTNILYINNYLNTDNVCMFQSWYLSVDTHLFIIAPFVIYPLWKWSRKGELLLGALSVAAALMVFSITYGYHLDPTLMAFPPEITDITLNLYYVFAYMKTHMRAISYCVGLIAGYSVHTLETSNTKLPNVILWMGWILAFAFGTTSLFSVTVFYLPHHENNPLESGIYASLHKVAWSFSIAWIMIACATNNAGPVRNFLSWRPFVPLSRLSYCAYLVNGAIELHSYGTLRSPTFMSVYNMAAIVMSHVLLTFTAGFILCIFFESPIHSIEKILLSIVYKKTKMQKDNAKL